MPSNYDDQPLNPDPLPNSNPPYGSPYPPSGAAAPFPPPPGQQIEEPKKKGCGCVGCLVGCLGTLLVLAIIAGVGAWWAMQKIPDWTRGIIDQVVQQSDLPEEDKKAVMVQVDRLVQGYKDGKVDMQKLGKFAENFVESPLMDLMIAYAAENEYIEPSGLSDEEKAEARLTIQRLARGVIEKKIPKESLDTALDHISTKAPNGARQFSEEVTDDELREFLAESKRLADEASIPTEEYRVDVGAELKKLVDEVLGEATDSADPQDI